MNFETLMLIATELGRPLYLKFGFSDVSNYLFMRRKTPHQGMLISSKIVEFSELPTKGVKMVLCKELKWKPKMMYSRIAGNFG